MPSAKDQTTVRLPSDVKRALQEKAIRDSRSMNDLITDILRCGLGLSRPLCEQEWVVEINKLRKELTEKGVL
jgi:plasmid stability protein